MMSRCRQAATACLHCKSSGIELQCRRLPLASRCVSAFSLRCPAQLTAVVHGTQPQRSRSDAVNSNQPAGSQLGIILTSAAARSYCSTVLRLTLMSEKSITLCRVTISGPVLRGNS